MKKREWVKFWTRNFGLFRYYVYMESNKLPFYKKSFGRIFHYGLTVPDGQLIAYYHDKAELELMSKKMFEVACKNAAVFEKFSRQVLGWMEDFISYNNNFKTAALKTLSLKQLEQTYQQWYKKYLLWQTGIYFFFVLEPVVTKEFTQELERYLAKNKKSYQLPEISKIIMSPEHMNAVTLEEVEALNTALKIKLLPGTAENQIRKFYQKFLWLPCYDVHHEPFEISYFKKRVAKLQRKSDAALKRQLIGIKKEFVGRKPAFKKLMTTIREPKIKELAKIMHSLVYYKDLRDDLRRQASFAAKTFMEFVAKKFSLSLEEINYLTPKEVQGLFKGNFVDKTEIQKRIPANYVLFSQPGKISLFEGQQAKQFLSRELPASSSAQQTTARGTPASKGLARGTVVIVRHTKALSRIKAGDILVALTTHPEYVPAMKKARAIVTDEGGITSHAAIVSRELHKPCVVGTKTATRIFKDGDIVEVDANKGTVTIVKQS